MAGGRRFTAFIRFHFLAGTSCKTLGASVGRLRAMGGGGAFLCMLGEVVAEVV